MPPPMMSVTAARRLPASTAGRSAGAGRAGAGAWFCAASRRMTRTSSSTERPLRAARSRNSSRMASSSRLMVRLAMGFGPPERQCASNASIRLTALQSELPDRPENPDKGGGDDPDRQGPPAVLAGLGPAEGGNRLRRQGDALAHHLFHVLEHGHRPAGQDRDAGG